MTLPAALHALALALLHFVWQGALLGVIALGAARALSSRDAALRYAVLHGLLWAMALAFAWTYAWLLASALGSHRPAGIEPTTPAHAGPMTLLGSAVLVAWSIGAAHRGLRLGLGLVGVARWRRRAVELPPWWSDALAELARAMGVRASVRIAALAGLDAPIVVGVLRPLVLVPLADERRADEVWHPHGHLASQRARREGLVDRRDTVSSGRRDHQVPQLDVGLEVEPATQPRMIDADARGEVVLTHAALHQPRLGGQRRADDEVDLAALERSDHPRPRLAHHRADAWGLAGGHLQHPRQDLELGEVGRHDHERPLAGGGVELLAPGQRTAQILERAAQPVPELLRACGRDQSAAAGHQQGILEQLAQPLEAVAHRRLRQAELRRRTGDIALPQQHVERVHEVEIDRTQIETTVRHRRRR